MGKGPTVSEGGLGLKSYYRGKIEEMEMMIKDKSHNLRRLEAQRNELNTQGQLMYCPAADSTVPCISPASRHTNEYPGLEAACALSTSTPCLP